MFFRSPAALALAFLLLAVGCYQFLRGRYYEGVSANETTTSGTLIEVHRGRSSNYRYRYQVAGTLLLDDTDTCKTPLTSLGCTKGAPVAVYYDRNNPSETLLQEFSQAGREKLFMGIWMAACGLLLIGLYFLFRRLLASPDESEDVNYDDPANEPEVIHVVPIE